MTLDKQEATKEVQLKRLEYEALPTAIDVVIAALSHKNVKIRISAAFKILDRIYGKPKVEGGDDEAQGYSLARDFALMYREAVENRELPQSTVPVVDGVHIIGQTTFQEVVDAVEETPKEVGTRRKVDYSDFPED